MNANESAAVARRSIRPLFARLTRLELAVFHARNAARARTRPDARAEQAHARGNVRAVARLHHERADVGAAHEVRRALALPDEIRATDGNARRGEVSDERRGEIEGRTTLELRVELGDDGGARERQVRLDLVGVREADHLLLQHHALESIAPLDSAVRKQLQPLAVVSDHAEALGHRHLEIAALLGLPVDDERLRPAAHVAALRRFPERGRPRGRVGPHRARGAARSSAPEHEKTQRSERSPTKSTIHGMPPNGPMEPELEPGGNPLRDVASERHY